VVIGMLERAGADRYRVVAEDVGSDDSIEYRSD
jgi:hypothetical protein